MSDPKANGSNTAELQPPTVLVVEPRRELPRLKIEPPVVNEGDEEDDEGGDATPTALPLLLPPGFLQVQTSFFQSMSTAFSDSHPTL